jgi:GTP-binding protein HflX
LAKVQGYTQGLKPNQLKQLENLYRRRLPPAELILAEQALALARLSAELGRQVGLVISRRGEVVEVVVGGSESLEHPDPARLRRGPSRLAGFQLLHTRLVKRGTAGAANMAINGAELGQLAQRRWDLLAVLTVDELGLPVALHVAHLLPQAVDGQDVRRLDPFIPGHPPEDFSRLVRSLGEELARQGAGREVGRSGNALLVSVTTGPRTEAEENLDELTELARSAGLAVRSRVIQRRQRSDPRTLMGPGKLAEVLALATRLGADVLVVDQELSPAQAHHLALSTDAGLKIIDRTQLILDIFAQRARTREGKLQVEMAQTRYLLPRLGMRDDGLSRLTGGIGGRGPGETRLEIDRRRVRERLHRLQRDLDEIGRQRQRRRERRQNLGLPVLSIVGYTNAGKSTLLNALTRSEVTAEGRLFATLDPTSRRLRFPREREVIITDTVGFIRDLPDELRQAFAATLEELNEADLLMHVADASTPLVEEQIAAVEGILAELDLLDVPRLLVLNKMDQAMLPVLDRLRRRHHGMAVSALNPATLPPLMKRIDKMVAGLSVTPPASP